MSRQPSIATAVVLVIVLSVIVAFLGAALITQKPPGDAYEWEWQDGYDKGWLDGFDVGLKRGLLANSTDTVFIYFVTGSTNTVVIPDGTWIEGKYVPVDRLPIILPDTGGVR